MKKQKQEIIPKFEKEGKAKVILTDKNGVEKEMDVARMVATAFVPNPNNYDFINHKNGNKLDNRAENLEWVSSHENHSEK